MNTEYIQKRRRRGIPDHRYRACLVLAIAVSVCLSGCGAVQSDADKGTADPVSLQTDAEKDAADPSLLQTEQAEDLPNPSEQKKDRAKQTVLKPGLQKQTPDIPYSDQIDAIIQNKDVWCFTMPDDEGEEYGVNESDYYYWVTDLDQNGYLEVISSSTTGNGCYFRNEYYEVSQDGKSLNKLAADEDEDAPSPDWWSIGEYTQGYYDGKTGTYHYPQCDHTHSGGLDTSDAQLDMVLSDGKVTTDTISYVESKSFEEPEKEDYGCVVEYYAGARAEKLGEVMQFYDEKTGELVQDTKQKTDYNKKLEKLYKQYYRNMQEFTVTFHSFCSVNEKSNKDKIEVVSDEILRKRAELSWKSFGIHVLNKKIPDNPFFPETASGDAEVRYLLCMLSEGRATMQIQEDLRGNDGVLYRVSFCDPREVSNREGLISKAEEKKSVKKQFKDYDFYLWVTDAQIYYIPWFDSYEEEVTTEDLENGTYTTDPDDRAIEDDYQKVRLVFYQEIPEYALLVCQEEELKDSLKEMEEGDHQWIEKHGKDIRCYRSYTSRGEGYDTANILQLVWKRGEGLIGVRSAAHPAGGNSQIFWKESFLKQEDVAFSIDNDTAD